MDMTKCLLEAFGLNALSDFILPYSNPMRFFDTYFTPVVLTCLHVIYFIYYVLVMIYFIFIHIYLCIYILSIYIIEEMFITGNPNLRLKEMAGPSGNLGIYPIIKDQRSIYSTKIDLINDPWHS